MERSVSPTSPRRQASVRASFQRRDSQREAREDPETDEDDASASSDVHGRGGGGGDASSSRDGAHSPNGPGAASRGDASPRIDRTVRTRTQDRITLRLALVDEEASGGDPLLRGWRSPHGEPYRPLGNPNLGLKFTPRLHGDAAPSPQRFASSEMAKDDAGGRRDPSTTTATAVRPSPPQPSAQVLSMFPRSLRKRPPEDRQVRLALRLQESIAQYSPEKTRGLRRTNPVRLTRVVGDAGGGDNDDDDDSDIHAALLRLQEQHRRSCGPEASSPSASPSASPRYHVQHGDASFLLLRGAVHQGAARLQLVRNGQNFLGAVPPSELLDLMTLKRRYDAAREKHVAELDTRRKLGANVIHLGSPAKTLAAAGAASAGNDDSDSDDDDPSHHHQHAHPLKHHAHATGTHDDAHLYLPYTTREPQPSPHKPLPTLAEFKAKAREERMPLRALVSSRGSMATATAPSEVSARNSAMSPRATPGSVASALGHTSPPRRTVQSIAALTPSQPPKLSRMQTRRGSVVLTARASVVGVASGAGAESGASLGAVDTGNDALARAVASVAVACEAFSPPPRVHSVVRLQGAVDSVEAVKEVQAQTLAKTLAALDQDRRDCLETKYRNLAIDTQLDVDMQRMRSTAELDRVDHVALNLASYSWYPELLRHLIASREPTHTLHPAELFCVEVIRRVASEGHAFECEQLRRLVLLLHPDDVAVVEVQQILTFLKRTLGVMSADWSGFFRTHGLPEPIEVFKPSEDSKLKEKKKQMRMSKFRSVIQIHQVLRRLTASTKSQ